MLEYPQDTLGFKAWKILSERVTLVLSALAAAVPAKEKRGQKEEKNIEEKE